MILDTVESNHNEYYVFLPSELWALSENPSSDNENHRGDGEQERDGLGDGSAVKSGFPLLTFGSQHPCRTLHNHL